MILDYQVASLTQARDGLDEAEAAMMSEDWGAAMVALMTVGWALDALRDKMPKYCVDTADEGLF